MLVKSGTSPDTGVPEVAELSLMVHLAHWVLVLRQLHHWLQELLAAPWKQLRLPWQQAHARFVMVSLFHLFMITKCLSHTETG